MTETDADRFPVNDGYDDAPFTDDWMQSSLDTATRWTLHMRVDGEPQEVSWLVDRLKERAFGSGYLGGDSWVEWCEPHPGGELIPRALHVLFRAPSHRIALMRARNIGRQLGQPWLSPTHIYLTIAQDWAEGTEVWAQP